MSDIAKKLNVSTMTVSKAFQNSPDISLQVKEKVLKTASELGYVYSKG
ncbi:MAG TPA: LacI family DNA-binding transcriptional regulator, partial [Acholeplasmataceae bacterium]|nr:LacI family DNA-binding transcriptional regulator [Acholeplasmataceae bacterium]